MGKFDKCRLGRAASRYWIFSGHPDRCELSSSDFGKIFVDTFGSQDRKAFVTGESYAGYYVSYIADAMLNKNDTIVSIIKFSKHRANKPVSQPRSYHDLGPIKILRCYPRADYSSSIRRLLAWPHAIQRFIHRSTPQYVRFLWLYRLSQHIPQIPTSRPVPITASWR